MCLVDPTLCTRASDKNTSYPQMQHTRFGHVPHPPPATLPKLRQNRTRSIEESEFNFIQTNPLFQSSRCGLCPSGEELREELGPSPLLLAPIFHVRQSSPPVNKHAGRSHGHTHRMRVGKEREERREPERGVEGNRETEKRQSEKEKRYRYRCQQSPRKRVVGPEMNVGEGHGMDGPGIQLPSPAHGWRNSLHGTGLKLQIYERASIK